MADVSDGVTRYACGYLLGDDGRAVLIRKNRPDWQAGRLNGVGGKVEPGETPHQAMVREFTEETGLLVESWEHFATIGWEDGETFFFRAHAPGTLLDQARTVTDEPIEVHPVPAVLALDPSVTVKSLRWLLALASYETPLAGPVAVREIGSPYTPREAAGGSGRAGAAHPRSMTPTSATARALRPDGHDNPTRPDDAGAHDG